MRTALMACALLCSSGALAAERYIVQLRDAERGRAALSASGAKVLLELGPQLAVAAEVPDAAAEALRGNPAIALLELDPPRYPLGQTQPYGIAMVQAPQVWTSATGANRKVCVIDSGFAKGHEDLQSSGLTGHPAGWDTDGCGHGTHVTGTIAALNNDRGVIGVLPNGVSLHVVKVFNDSCRWSYASTLIDAANRCEAAGANVISMSLGGPWASSTEESAFARLYANGLLSVAAAGNDGTTRYSYPASYDSVISVGALNSSKQIASFSQKNSQVDLAAPGVAVLSTVPGNRYESWSGTSMATPHVAAVAALIWSYDTRWTNVQVRDALQSTAEDLGAAGRDDAYGHGLVRAKVALDHLLSVPTTPTAPIELTASASRRRGQWYVNLSWSGANGAQVDIFRDEQAVIRTVNDGSHSDPVPQRGTYRYRVCETSGDRCSAAVTITF